MHYSRLLAVVAAGLSFGNHPHSTLGQTVGDGKLGHQSVIYALEGTRSGCDRM